jgi:polar amino acid transport system substrate-binding protein
VLRFSLIAIALLITPLETINAAEDKVAFGTSRPPYVMQDRGTGISLELFKLIYDRLGRQFWPSYVSNERLARSLSAGTVDVAVEVKKTHDELFYSDSFVSYQNFIVTRQVDKRVVNAFSDLSGMSVCTWQNADEHLGPDFQDAMKTFRYKGFANQDAQVRVFLGGRCDSVVIDRKIFQHWTKTFSNDATFKKHIVSLDFDYWPVPGQSENVFYVGFKNNELRNQFDGVLANIKASGEYDKIVNWSDWSKPPSE